MKEVQGKGLTLSPGARRLPTHHITIRVPWHDSGWVGSVCARPLENSSCLILPRIGESRNDEAETKCAGQRIDELEGANIPPCIGERASFMAPFEIRRTMRHPYAESSADTHGHFKPTGYSQPQYSAACVPFRWMLRGNVEGDAKAHTIGLAEQLKLDWIPDREPDLKFKTSWVQERDNQLVLLDTFFGALRPEESLCFFYAKRTPLSDQTRRVIIGVGRVLSVGQPTEYGYSGSNPPLRCELWERNLGHSIRTGFKDGFLFPYQDILTLAERDGFDPEEFVAFAPDEHFASYSYASELLPHDGALASLVACAAALHKIKTRVEGPWDAVLGWIDTQLNRIWQARGAYPGLGSAISAFGFEWGFQHGNLLAYELELLRESSKVKTSVWKLLDEVKGDPTRIGNAISSLITPGVQKGWKRLPEEKRALLELLSRCAISMEQALRMYDNTTRQDNGVEATDQELIKNPYLLIEKDRRSFKPIAFDTVDHGLFPDASIQREYPLPEASKIEDSVDPRRVRALVACLLHEATEQGHTLLPRSWVIRRARERGLQPVCPLGEGVLGAIQETFAPIIISGMTANGEPSYQLDRMDDCRDIIGREVLPRKKGKPHSTTHDWEAIVEKGLGPVEKSTAEEAQLEHNARREKTAALEQMYKGRICVLIGSAGTGKTTLLRMLCSIDEVDSRGVLLLAPTGKARVRLEEQTHQRGKGRTLAQFLNRYNRFNGETQACFPNSKAPKCSDYRTVIVDEASMLTEEQLAALFDTCTNVDRYVLVGDPRQLPPIGAGRPFVDIINQLEPPYVDALFPKCASSYAELTIPRRQKTVDSADIMLAGHFSGKRLDPGADEVWDKITANTDSRLKLVQWNDAKEIEVKIIEQLVTGLGLSDEQDELNFELSIGGTQYKELTRAFFGNKYGNNPGAASKAEAWQILAPTNPGLYGVETINRVVQQRFRAQWKNMATAKGWARKVTSPFGAQGILYGDKVINVINQKRRDVYPTVEGDAYIANGDLGVVVGQYKTPKSNYKGLPYKMEVEFAGQLGHKFGFSSGEFGDEGSNPLQLAYALTIHKTQGSEFGMTFLVLPNPCWILSRELLYTALTRHRDQLVVLHQGPFIDFRRFAGDEYSEIAKRITNLFDAPSPREITVGQTARFFEDRLIHRTERGELVRSKSEVIIADKLFARKIDYAYEQPLHLPNGRVRYPDFTIANHASGVTYYWEHLGLLQSPSYRARWERKKEDYRVAGILPHLDGGGPEGSLIETEDDSKGGIDAHAIGKLIDDVVLHSN